MPRRSFNKTAKPAQTGIDAPVRADGATVLHLAVQAHDEKTAKRLLRINANPDAVDEAGQTPVFTAVTLENLEMVRLLRDSSANLGHRDEKGRSLIDWAVEQGRDARFIQALAEIGAPMDAHPKSRRTPLHYAAAKNRADLMMMLTVYGLSPNDKDSLGDTPLHMAAEQDATEALAWMLAAGADPNIRNNGLRTPLYLAAQRGHEAATTLLLKQPDVRRQINEHRCYGKGFTPLMEAAAADKPDIVRMLIAAGADVNQQDTQDRNSLTLAADKGAVQAARVLLQHGADVQHRLKNGQPLAMTVGDKNYEEMMSLLHLAGLDINVRDSMGRTALYHACEDAEADKIKTLLLLGADTEIFNNYGRRPIDVLGEHYSYVFADSYATMNLLLTHGAKPDISPHNAMLQSPLHAAAGKGHVKAVSVLLAHGAKIDAAARTADGLTPLLAAARAGQLDVLKLLHEKGANIRRRDRNGNTALHLAAIKGSVEVMNYLLDQKEFDIAAASPLGDTPLHLACRHENNGAAVFLAALGAPLTIADSQGDTPLHLAARSGDDDFVQEMNDAQKQKPDWNVKSPLTGSTPLHVAAGNGFLAVLEQLVKLGADPTLRNARGKTPLHDAITHNHGHVAIFLIDKMRKRGMDLGALRDRNDWTLAHYAAACGEEATLKALAKAGCPLDTPAKNGDTPLHIAARGGYEDMIDFLTAGKRAVGVLTKNRAGQTPIDIAAAREYEYLVEKLTPLAAKFESPPARAKPPKKPRARRTPKP